jgi:hypothetical protein
LRAVLLGNPLVGWITSFQVANTGTLDEIWLNNVTDPYPLDWKAASFTPPDLLLEENLLNPHPTFLALLVLAKHTCSKVYINDFPTR